jgi:hypothetical protein
MAKDTKVGKVTHYYDHLGVGIVKLIKPLKVGQTVKIGGKTTNFDQLVSEMQYDHKDIKSGKKGQEVGVKVNSKVRPGDEVSILTSA